MSKFHSGSPRYFMLLVAALAAFPTFVCAVESAKNAAPPQPKAIIELYNVGPAKGELLHEVVVSKAMWTDSATTTESWDALGQDGAVLRRTQCNLGTKDKPSTASATVENKSGMWAVLASQKRAVRFPSDTSEETPAVKDKSPRPFDYASWPSKGVEKTKVNGVACWALVQTVPDAVRDYYKEQAEGLKGIFGIEQVGPFLPKLQKIIVDERCSAVLAKEMIADNGMVIVSESIKRESLKLDVSIFEIPKDFKLEYPSSEDEFLSTTSTK